MTQTIKFTSNEQFWKLDNLLKKLGYRKTSDCYWAMIYEHDEIGSTVSLVRE